MVVGEAGDGEGLAEVGGDVGGGAHLADAHRVPGRVVEVALRPVRNGQQGFQHLPGREFDLEWQIGREARRRNAGRGGVRQSVQREDEIALIDRQCESDASRIVRSDAALQKERVEPVREAAIIVDDRADPVPHGDRVDHVPRIASPLEKLVGQRRHAGRGGDLGGDQRAAVGADHHFQVEHRGGSLAAGSLRLDHVALLR